MASNNNNKKIVIANEQLFSTLVKLIAHARYQIIFPFMYEE